MFRGSSQDVSLRDDLISNRLDHSLHSLGHALLSQKIERVKTRHGGERESRREGQKTDGYSERQQRQK